MSWILGDVINEDLVKRWDHLLSPWIKNWLRLGMTLNSDPPVLTSGSIWDYRPVCHHQGIREMGSQIQGLWHTRPVLCPWSYVSSLRVKRNYLDERQILCSTKREKQVHKLSGGRKMTHLVIWKERIHQEPRKRRPWIGMGLDSQQKRLLRLCTS